MEEEPKSSIKKFTVIILLLVLLVVVVVAFFVLNSDKSQDTGPKQKEFSSKNYGFSFKYPESWQVDETGNVIALTVGESENKQVALALITQEETNTETVAEQFNKIMESSTSFLDSESEDGQFYNLSGKKFTHRFKDNGNPEFYTYILQNGNNVLEARITMSVLDYAEDQQIINEATEVLSSLDL